MKNTVGTKNYNGQDWFWPHDYRHYLRDANARQRKLIHNGWLKIGVPVKKSGLKISDRYLQPKKNQMKKAWDIVRKVVAPKELGQPIPESTNEGLGDKFSKRLAKYNKKNKKSRDAMKKYAKVKKIKLKGRGVYQDYDGLDEATYQLPKRYTATNIDELDAALNRAGINGIPDFTKKTWTTMHDKVNHSKLKKIMKKIGAKKIKEGSCGYGVDGKVGKEPAGSHLLKKKKRLEYESTSVNESREIDKVYGDFEVLLKDFENEFISLSAQAGRANDNKADERIMIKTLKKHLPPLYSMVRSWKRSSK